MSKFRIVKNADTSIETLAVQRKVGFIFIKWIPLEIVNTVADGVRFIENQKYCEKICHNNGNVIYSC